MQEDFIVCSSRPDINGTYLGQEGFIRTTTLSEAQQYLQEKQQGKKDPSSVKLYRLVAVD